MTKDQEHKRRETFTDRTVREEQRQERALLALERIANAAHIAASNHGLHLIRQQEAVDQVMDGLKPILAKVLEQLERGGLS